jgi:hypothetical protein
MSDTNATAPFDWRAHLPVHPAADLFPLMSETDPQALKELAEDIRKNGLQCPVLIHHQEAEDGTRKSYLIDGRNRLDAFALLGWLGPKRERRHRERENDYGRIDPLTITYPTGNDAFGLISPTFRHNACFDDRLDLHDDGDVYRAVLALNIHRRHLTAEQKRDLIAQVLKLQPETSDRKIGEAVKADHKTVASVRAELESTGEISPVEKRVGADGKARKQPIHWRKRVHPDVAYEAADRGVTARTIIEERQGPSAGAEKPPTFLDKPWQAADDASDYELPSIREASAQVIHKCLDKVQASVRQAVESLSDDPQACTVLFDQLESCVTLLRAEAKRKDIAERVAA